LSHNYGTNLALPGTMQINSGTVPAIPSGRPPAAEFGRRRRCKDCHLQSGCKK